MPDPVPLRLLDTLHGPVRDHVARRVRRSIGIGEPRPSATDPDEAFLAPGGVARRVHGDLPAMLIGGLEALLLQMLHPLAMAGVAEHSNYREDPDGRLRRTADFLGTTTYGTTAEAHRAIQRVRQIYRRVRGVAPDGRPYAAGDPELVTWIHATETASFLASARRYGPYRLSDEECDRYYAEMSVVAYELGAEWVPRSAAEMEAYFRRVRPELYVGAQAREARDFLLRGTVRRPNQQLAYAVLLAAAIGLLPAWARDELSLSEPPMLDALFVRPLARTLSYGLRWVAPPRR